MGHLLESVAAAHTPFLWLDDTAYAGRLLAGGHPPWNDVSAAIAHLRSALGLLRSDVAAIDVWPVLQSWLEAHPALRTDLQQAAKPERAVRRLLEDPALQTHLVALIQGLGAASAGRPVALVMPGPLGWVRAQMPNEVVDEDAIDAVAVYMAAFLRAFGGVRLDALLLDERADPTPPDLREPLLNLARHYRWDVGLRLSQVEDKPSSDGFVIAPQGGLGVELGALFWAGAPALEVAVGGFRFAEIPVDAVPETVLARLRPLWR